MYIWRNEGWCWYRVLDTVTQRRKISFSSASACPRMMQNSRSDLRTRVKKGGLAVSLYASGEVGFKKLWWGCAWPSPSLTSWVRPSTMQSMFAFPSWSTLDRLRRSTVPLLDDGERNVWGWWDVSLNHILNKLMINLRVVRYIEYLIEWRWSGSGVIGWSVSGLFISSVGQKNNQPTWNIFLDHDFCFTTTSLIASWSRFGKKNY